MLREWEMVKNDIEDKYICDIEGCESIRMAEGKAECNVYIHT